MVEANSSVEYHQIRGAAWDIIDEAIETYLEWMGDDDYDSMAVLKKIMNKMIERKTFYDASVSARDAAQQVLDDARMSADDLKKPTAI